MRPDLAERRPGRGRNLAAFPDERASVALAATGQARPTTGFPSLEEQRTYGTAGPIGGR